MSGNRTVQNHTLTSVALTILIMLLLVFQTHPGKAESGAKQMTQNPSPQTGAEEKTPATGKQNSEPKFENRLIHEKSPYLLQHANNPVDWYPWGDEAFEKARKENKPIFLSIGYSTCHWCHVMEHETFENEDAARLMNDAFVSIKVDREERPDIDHIYMTVCQMMTQGGGWPLNIIMTPDKKPFFAATYIPRESRFGRLGMMDLTKRVKEMWATRKDEVVQSADKILTALRQVPDGLPGNALDEDGLKDAYDQLGQRFDAKKGGFGQAPKFPTPHNLLFLLRYWKRSGDDKALQMVEKTLQAMRLGGIYDHVGFGFHRYSTDEDWLVPHFEKMLYDQALLAMAYTEAFQATGKEEYKRTAEEIFTYVFRDMTAPGGGFYSAEDADSEGEEGKFYVWTQGEFYKVLGEDDARFAGPFLNVTTEGNFHEEASGRLTGANILHTTKTLPESAKDLGISEEDLDKRLERIRVNLFEHREKRIHPYKDDKILTDWNGLMIAALAKAAQVFDDPRYSEAAAKSADFVLKEMRDSKGRLLHRYRDGQAAIPALVDDYAFFIQGLLELYEATFQTRFLRQALELNEDFLERFWDDGKGGFFFTADDAESLIVRKKESYDGATPSGNSVAAYNLLRLGRIAAKHDLEEKADRIGKVFAGNVRQMPSAFTMLLSAVDFGIGPSFEVVLTGKLEDAQTKAMLRELRKPFLPNMVVVFRPEGERSSEIAAIAEYTKYQEPVDGKTTAYVCRNFQCEFPTTDPAQMLELLKLKGK
ncbi:thioredoxin domain-containing protein [Thermodesulfobacteriota bacterium]